MKRLIALTILTCLFVGAWGYGQCNQAINPLVSFLSEDPNDTHDPNEVGDPNDPDELIDPNDLDEVDDPNDPGE
jgi:hypothetical protein